VEETARTTGTARFFCNSPTTTTAKGKGLGVTKTPVKISEIHHNDGENALILSSMQSTQQYTTDSGKNGKRTRTHTPPLPSATAVEGRFQPITN
jgi:hypothetical protein